MAKFLKPHKLTVTVGTDTRTYFFLSGKDTYTGVAAETGVDAATAAELDEPLYPKDELVRKGLLQYVGVSFTKNSKLRFARLAISRSKLGAIFDASSGLKGKDFQGGKVVSVTGINKVSLL